jgi:hypothetical protein
MHGEIIGDITDMVAELEADVSLISSLKVRAEVIDKDGLGHRIVLCLDCYTGDLVALLQSGTEEER